MDQHCWEIVEALHSPTLHGDLQDLLLAWTGGAMEDKPPNSSCLCSYTCKAPKQGPSFGMGVV